MKIPTPQIRLLACGTLLAVLSIAAPRADAAVITWGGSNGEYTTGGNWVGGSVPDTNGGDTALITSGDVNYTPGGDLAIHSGGALQISGGSWTQTGGIAWIQLGGGSLIVDGGVFNQGSSQNIVRNSSTLIKISSGTANFSGNFIYQTSSGTLSLTGGVMNVQNEFKPIDTFSMTAGTLNSTLISFADGPGSINFSGGLVSVDGSGAFSGFYGGGAKGLNFTTGSSGTLFIENYTLAELSTDGFLTNGTIQLNGAASASSFTTFEQDGGVYVTLSIPEPGSMLLLGASLGAVLIFRRRSVMT